MGYIMHDAVIVTAYKKSDIDVARTKATSLKLAVSEVVASPTNGYLTFLIVPDGSKEGWADSDLGDQRRAKWLVWAESARKTSHVFIRYVHVRYGDDEATVENEGF